MLFFLLLHSSAKTQGGHCDHFLSHLKSHIQLLRDVIWWSNDFVSIMFETLDINGYGEGKKNPGMNLYK